ncbi:MAG TPA: amino acid ABC transporter permease [Acidimicrobiia bacterium]|jgi:general L-amino acid transport system permease protein|nr:amino acid ABC transporter permease [Acidimicrobiia bacterium]
MTVDAPVFEEAPPQVEPARGPMDWVRKNLFNNWYNSLLTVALAAFVVWALVALVRGLLSAEYEIIRANLRLFMIGEFPADLLWRPWAATYCFAVMFGVVGGSLAAGARDRASEAGLPYVRTTLRQIVIRFWPILALIAVILSFTTTLTPTLLTIGALVVGLGSYYLGRVLPRAVRRWTWLIAVVLIAASYISLAGFGGVGWQGWGGLQLNLFLTFAGLLVAFPFGLLLAMGRRSSLPVIRTISVGYIELVRGVPLITVLIAGAFAIGFIIPRDVRPGFVTRMLIAIIAFEAAYIAEVVRGGLQAVPHGQVEAAQAVGLAPWKTMRLIVLPQALRATIPAMVGQFISLFKDTTLVAVLGITELLEATFVVNSQTAYLGKGLFVVTLSFAALIFWVGCYTMSRESRRLERKLGVGER